MIEKENNPKHVAIIMDGNRRWAKEKSKLKNLGHREGMFRLKEIVEESIDLGIEILTVYAFSTENWGREAKEVNYLLKLLIEFSKKMIKSLDEAGVKINIIGETETLPDKIKIVINQMVAKTCNNEVMNFNIAFNYGSRLEIVNACKKIINDVQNNIIDTKDIDEIFFAEYLYTGTQSDPDLMIRTSGEKRLSNFLLYQLAYTEFYFTDVLWPDFTKYEFRNAIIEYQKRKRRFGKM